MKMRNVVWIDDKGFHLEQMPDPAGMGYDAPDVEIDMRSPEVEREIVEGYTLEYGEVK